MKFLANAAAIAAMSVCIPAASFAQDAAAPVADGAIQIELNSAGATEDGGCRLTMVTTNRTETGLSRAAWQVAIFDGAGIVQALSVLDFGDLSAGKTKIGLFELPGRACTDISRIVVNDVAECRGTDDSDQHDACLGGLATLTKTDIDFGV